jgi:hypothetical protein
MILEVFILRGLRAYFVEVFILKVDRRTNVKYGTCESQAIALRGRRKKGLKQGEHITRYHRSIHLST